MQFETLGRHILVEYYNCDPCEIVEGESTSISWSVENAEEVYLDIERVELSGERDISISEDTTIYLSAINPLGKSVTSIRIFILDQPYP